MNQMHLRIKAGTWFRPAFSLLSTWYNGSSTEMSDPFWFSVLFETGQLCTINNNIRQVDESFLKTRI